jgi:hypothetical protein
MGTFKCPSCESDIFAKFQKLAKSKEHEFNIQMRVSTPSQLLVDMLIEEAEHNAKDIVDEQT